MMPGFVWLNEIALPAVPPFTETTIVPHPPLC